MAGGGGQQGASAPTQNGPNVYGGGVNPQAPQFQTNRMQPVPAPSGGPYGGFNAQGQDAVNTAQTNYNQSGGQGQLTQAQQAAIAYNADPQGQPAPQWMSGTAYAQTQESPRMKPMPLPPAGPYGDYNAQLPFSEPPPPLTAAPAAPSSYRIDPMILMADANGQEIKHDDQRFIDYMNGVYSTPAPYQGSQTPAAPTNYINSNAAPPGPPPDIMQYGAPPPPQGMPPQGMPPQFQPQARQPLQVKKNMNIAAPQRHNIQVLGNPTAAQYVPRGRRGVR